MGHMVAATAQRALHPVSAKIDVRALNSIVGCQAGRPGLPGHGSGSLRQSPTRPVGCRRRGRPFMLSHAVVGFRLADVQPTRFHG